MAAGDGTATPKTPEEGHDVTIATLGPGMFFGELSLLDSGPRTVGSHLRRTLTRVLPFFSLSLYCRLLTARP